MTDMLMNATRTRAVIGELEAEGYLVAVNGIHDEIWFDIIHQVGPMSAEERQSIEYRLLAAYSEDLKEWADHLLGSWREAHPGIVRIWDGVPVRNFNEEDKYKK
ncbi:hypothetical protein CVC04_001786 [Salmonella enterica subsp. enterica serovar Cerro]|nr:hypothetical protein [Salmonella enterica subsp. enterica serovar Cerro]